MEREDFSYSNTYGFSVDIETVNPKTGEIEVAETISGDVTFSADAEWNESAEEYEYSSIYWSETSGRFDDVNGDAPSMEAAFLKDFRNYLISQGVDSGDIGW